MASLLLNLSPKALQRFLELCDKNPKGRDITMVPLTNGRFHVIIQKKKLTFWEELLIAFTGS